MQPSPAPLVKALRSSEFTYHVCLFTGHRLVGIYGSDETESLALIKAAWRATFSANRGILIGPGDWKLWFDWAGSPMLVSEHTTEQAALDARDAILVQTVLTYTGQ